MPTLHFRFQFTALQCLAWFRLWFHSLFWACRLLTSCFFFLMLIFIIWIIKVCYEFNSLACQYNFENFSSSSRFSFPKTSCKFKLIAKMVIFIIAFRWRWQDTWKEDIIENLKQHCNPRQCNEIFNGNDERIEIGIGQNLKTFRAELLLRNASGNLLKTLGNIWRAWERNAIFFCLF